MMKNLQQGVSALTAECTCIHTHARKISVRHSSSSTSRKQETLNRQQGTEKSLGSQAHTPAPFHTPQALCSIITKCSHGGHTFAALGLLLRRRSCCCCCCPRPTAPVCPTLLSWPTTGRVDETVVEAAAERGRPAFAGRTKADAPEEPARSSNEVVAAAAAFFIAHPYVSISLMRCSCKERLLFLFLSMRLLCGLEPYVQALVSLRANDSPLPAADGCAS